MIVYESIFTLKIHPILGNIYQNYYVVFFTNLGKKQIYNQVESVCNDND